MALPVILAVIGLLIGGFRGLLIGAAIGIVVAYVRRNMGFRALGRSEPQLIESIFSVMGALCKADSVVTREEIRTAEHLFARLNLSADQRTLAKAAFQRGKSPDFDLDDEVAKFVRAARGRAGMMQLFLQLQISAIGSDGEIHPAEHTMLVRIARGLGLGEAAVAQLEALLRTAAGGGRPGQGAPASGEQLDDAYAALGISASASDQEVKRAYRRLVSQNHPDKLASKGMPESMREVAEERTREINTAYELVKESRPTL